MSVKKAVKIIDWWIEQKKQGIEELQENWLSKGDKHGLGQALLDIENTIVSNLEVIRGELVPKCKHPKKMRDKDPDGNWYCMNCNFDL